MKGEVPDYSLDFTKIREMRKQNKRDVSRASIGNEEELITPNAAKSNTATIHRDHHDDYQQSHHHTHSPTNMDMKEENPEYRSGRPMKLVKRRTVSEKPEFRIFLHNLA
ncbi:hypothetical protein CDL15_Pgr001845 [Punica granatum]|uniref:Uncharacterized protein n=1 Tax=Punica granatum TaxID=22663 RepID=A0A218XCN1_PUNGR|nr:hypothetical protein CDL15_Pgr001845 [Punica granatum]